MNNEISTLESRLLLQGRRVRELRECLRLKPNDLALELNLGNTQSIYDLEAGRRDLKAWEAVQLANMLGVSTEFLVGSEVKSADRIAWRGEPDPKIENLLRTRIDRFLLLRKLSAKHSGSSPPVFKIEADASYERIEEIASEIARLLNLGEYPARSLSDSLLRKWNVIVFNHPLESGSGACVRKEDLCGILLNSDEPWWRRNFSLGHEVFHLVVEHNSKLSPKREETLANVFSSRLLMPGESVVNEIRKIYDTEGKITYFDLMKLAREYMVSTEALLWRLHNLDILGKNSVERFVSDPNLRDLDKEMRSEARSDAFCLPKEIVLLAYEVYLKGCISIGKLAEILETTVGMLKSMLQEYGITAYSSTYETTISPS